MPTNSQRNHELVWANQSSRAMWRPRKWRSIRRIVVLNRQCTLEFIRALSHDISTRITINNEHEFRVQIYNISTPDTTTVCAVSTKALHYWFYFITESMVLHPVLTRGESPKVQHPKLIQRGSHFKPGESSQFISDMVSFIWCPTCFPIGATPRYLTIVSVVEWHGFFDHHHTFVLMAGSGTSPTAVPIAHFYTLKSKVEINQSWPDSNVGWNRATRACSNIV